MMAMKMLPGMITSDLMMILPWPLLLAGLVVGIGADRNARLMKRMALGAAWFALVCAVLAAATFSLGLTESKTYGSLALPVRLGFLSERVEVNTLTVVMLVLVALVGMIVARYSYTYLDGDRYEGRFHRWLSFTLGAFLMMVGAGNLWGFLVVWLATSWGLHHLMAYYPERPAAVLAARKKYLLDRIADVSLLVAFVLFARTLHTSTFAGITHAVAEMHGALPVSIEVASGFLVLSVILKSAQFPLHGWLIHVMEAPTPVSALLHAGIIYTGAFLLLRTVSVISRVPWAGDVLLLVGLGSIAVASLMMMTATNIKGSLAYSTCGQMGFVLMECGMGLYTLAFLHIVSHSVYKAHAFLSSGSVVEPFRGPALASVARAPSWGKAIGSLVIAVPIVAVMALVFRIPGDQQMPLVIMGVILTVAIEQLLLQSFTKANFGGARFLWAILALSALVSAAFFGLEALAGIFFSSALPAREMAWGIIGDGILVLIGMVFAGLLLVQQMWPRLLRYPFWQAAYVHLSNDLYMDMLFTHSVRKWGPRTAAEPRQDKPDNPSWEMLP